MVYVRHNRRTFPNRRRSNPNFGLVSRCLGRQSNKETDKGEDILNAVLRLSNE